MTERVLYQTTLRDDWNRKILITQTDAGYYRKILTLGYDDSRNPHGRPISEYQYNHMLRRARAQGNGRS